MTEQAIAGQQAALDLDDIAAAVEKLDPDEKAAILFTLAASAKLKTKATKDECWADFERWLAQHRAKKAAKGVTQ